MGEPRATDWLMEEQGVCDVCTDHRYSVWAWERHSNGDHTRERWPGCPWCDAGALGEPRPPEPTMLPPPHACVEAGRGSGSGS